MTQLPDRQNKDGLKSYRRRLRTRALTLAGNREFRQAVDDFRALWNRGAPRYTITVVSSIEELNSSPLIYHGPAGYAPQRWIDDLIKLMFKLPNWNERVGSSWRRSFLQNSMAKGVTARQSCCGRILPCRS
jgi:hypothetical protein